jgi:hypothetical protein
MTEYDASLRSSNSHFRLQTHLHVLAAAFTRALLSFSRPLEERAQGRPGAGWHPRPVCGKDALGVHNRRPRPPRPSLREWLYGLCRALPGERCTIAPVTLRMTDVRIRLDHAHHHKTWRTDPGRQDHTILPSAHIPVPLPDGWRALAIRTERRCCQRRVVPRSCCSRSTPEGARPATWNARRRSRGHRLPARVS